MSLVKGTDPNFLSVADLAERYGVSPATVHTWLYQQTSPRSYKIGKRRLFKLADVIEWEDKHVEDGGGNDDAAA